MQRKDDGQKKEDDLERLRERHHGLTVSRMGIDVIDLCNSRTDCWQAFRRLPRVIRLNSLQRSSSGVIPGVACPQRSVADSQQRIDSVPEGPKRVTVSVTQRSKSD